MQRIVHVKYLTTSILFFHRTKFYVDALFEMKVLSIDGIVGSGWEEKMTLGFGRWRAVWTKE